MKHRSHLIPFAIVAMVAMFVLVPRSSTGFGVGIGFILLLCPLVMGTMMWLMMRRPDAPTEHREHFQAQLNDDRQPVSGDPHR